METRRNGHAKSLGLGESGESKLRYWEQKGLLPRPEDENYKLAAEFVLAARRGGMSTQRIKSMIARLEAEGAPLDPGASDAAAGAREAPKITWADLFNTPHMRQQMEKSRHAQVMDALQQINRQLAAIALALSKVSK